MKRLFNVAGVDFESKEAAKHHRNLLWQKGVPNAKVSLGVDHRLYCVKGNPKTHSHNCRSGGHGNGFRKHPLR